MLKYKLFSFRFIIVFALILTSQLSKAQYFLIGPTIHYNIGDGLKNISGGLEFSYWNWEQTNDLNLLPIGMDIGIEFEKSKTRIYSELETGLIIGASIGYVYEMNDNQNTSGFQCSIWGAVYGGIELRYRVNDTNYFAPGGFFKFPLYKREPHLFGSNPLGSVM